MGSAPSPSSPYDAIVVAPPVRTGGPIVAGSRVVSSTCCGAPVWLSPETDALLRGDGVERPYVACVPHATARYGGSVHAMVAAEARRVRVSPAQMGEFERLAGVGAGDQLAAYLRDCGVRPR